MNREFGKWFEAGRAGDVVLDGRERREGDVVLVLSAVAALLGRRADDREVHAVGLHGGADRVLGADRVSKLKLL